MSKFNSCSGAIKSITCHVILTLQFPNYTLQNHRPKILAGLPLAWLYTYLREICWYQKTCSLLNCPLDMHRKMSLVHYTLKYICNEWFTKFSSLKYYHNRVLVDQVRGLGMNRCIVQNYCGIFARSVVLFEITFTAAGHHDRASPSSTPKLSRYWFFHNWLDNETVLLQTIKYRRLDKFQIRQFAISS